MHPLASPEGTSVRTKTRSKGDDLYAKRNKIYTLHVDGRFQRLRHVTLTLLILFFYVLPWLQWSGRQAVWFDLPNRKFYILGLTFWPQDFILLSWLLIIGAFSLFFFTAWAGRLWCGYACPETVWTKYFIWIEELIEGDRNKRILLDRKPWTAGKIARKTTKQFLWILLSFSIGFTAVGLFTPVRALFHKLITLQLGPSESFWLLFVTVMIYLLCASLREQVCIYMCPYARFQSVMFDRDTLIISYDAKRGEPRGKRKRGIPAENQGKGSCIDCKLCVYACPTGIDIRNGLQIECIGCAACIDVCDGVMDKMGYEPGLIRYCTENELEGIPKRKISPRLIGYGMVLAVMVGLFTYEITHRVPLGLDIIRDRRHLYRETFDGGIENTYTLKILNMDQVGHRYRIKATAAFPLVYGGKEDVFVAAGQMLALPVHVTSPAQSAEEGDRTSALYFTVESIENPKIFITEDSRFVRPRSEENEG